MKSLYISFILIGIIYISSCKKEEAFTSQNTYFKAITGDSDVIVIGGVQLTDGNYLIVSGDEEKRNRGYMVKLDGAGNVLWEKRVDTLTTTIWKVLSVPGNKFAIIGFETDDWQKKSFNVGIYNNEGELITTKVLPTSIDNEFTSQADVIHLSNGNYVFAFGNWWNASGYYLFTDNNFNLLSVRIFSPSSLPNIAGCSFKKICETANGEIIFTAATSSNAIWGPVPESYTMMLKTDLSGVQKSLNAVADSGFNEIPNGLIKFNDGLLCVSARKSNINNMGGVFVNYQNGPWGSETISGRISLCTYDNDGVLTARKEISNYPKNGQINSIKQAADGGFIMCGTVGQENSAYMVSKTKIFLLKVDANLNVQWSKTIATVYPSFGVEVIQMSDGGYLVSGHQRSFNTNYSAVIIKTDANGNY